MQTRFTRAIAALFAVSTLGAASAALAAPTVSRLTPPSQLFATNGAQASPLIARFLPGQRFDLQATIRPDAGRTINTDVRFYVDNVLVTTGVAATTAGTAGGLPANTLVASIRAYSNATPGVHTLKVSATQSDSQTVEASGNFEVVAINTVGRKVKNIIIMVGDGMGAAHRTAARVMAKGYAQGKAQGRLAMDTFPFTGMVMTSSLDSIVTDSAPGMANYVNGNKANNNQEGVWPDDTTDAFDNPRIEYVSEYLKRTRGTSLGIVTTADVFDATPAANAVHTSARGNGTGIVDQYLDDRDLTGLTVLMGGGRKWFIPKNSVAAPFSSPAVSGNGSARSNGNDYVLPGDVVAGWGANAGVLNENRDLITDFQSAGFTYASNKTTLDAAGVPDKLLGLFSLSNMNVAFDKINGRRGATSIVNDYGFPDQPLLEEMTDKALKVLAKNPAGFVLMVEGASIDKQAHLMDSDRWIVDTIEFDRAIQVAKDFAAATPDTLVIITADHECSGAAIIGASLKTAADLQALASGSPHTTAAQRDAVVGLYEAAKFPKYTIQPDGYPSTTDVDFKMLIGYGSNADRYETWLSSAQPAQDSQQPFVNQPPLNTYPANPSVRNGPSPGPQPGVLIVGQIPGNQAAHTATDIPLSAYGRGASLFTGVMDNTDVFFKLMQAAVGGAN
jgi:alkaline phosphatase